jgi:DNA-directed RNA polymerase specialized sigma24 family protein
MNDNYTKEERQRLISKYGEIKDKELLARMFDGRDDSLALYYLLKVKYIALLRFLLYTYNEYDGEEHDFIQDMYILLSESDYHALRTYREEAKFSTWLYLVASRFLYKKSKKARRWNSLEDISSADAIQYTDFDAGVKLELDIMLKYLPPKYRKVLTKLCREDEASKKVAKEMNTTVNNIYNMKRRAIVALSLVVAHHAKEPLHA